MTTAPRVSGVILAAGASTRLGRPKQLLDLHGEPLLRRVVRNAVSSTLDEVVLVLGHRADEIAAAVGNLGQRVTFNPRYAEGQSTSVIAGLAAIDPTAGAVLFLVGDQPGVDAAIIDAVIASFVTNAAPIVMPSYGGVPANPVLFGRSKFPELLTITGDIGAREIVRGHRDWVVTVAVSDRPPPGDIDTDEDYTRVLSELKEKRTS